MFNHPKTKEGPNRGNYESNNEYIGDEFDGSNFYNRSNFRSPVENDGTFDPDACDQSPGSRSVHGRNDYTSQSPDSSLPYKVNKNWNYKAILNDKGYPRIKLSMGKIRKSKSKKSRDNFSPYGNDDFNSTALSTKKVRSKTGSSKKSSRKKSLKRREKLSAPITNNSYNGLSSTNSVYGHGSNYQNNLVPTLPNTDIELDADVGPALNHYGGGSGEAEYAPQYLELKPSVKFKCRLCGTTDFSSMALLQEHFGKCDGHPSASTAADSLLQLSSSLGESGSSHVARNLKIKRKVLLCSSCGTYYQHYNLYMHMRDTHNKEICLFCRSTFSEAQQLWDHLISTHNLSTMRYFSAAQVRDSFKSFFITCCSCNAVFSDQDEFGDHECPSAAEESLEALQALPNTSSESAAQLLAENMEKEFHQHSERNIDVNDEDGATPIDDERMSASNSPLNGPSVDEVRDPDRTIDSSVQMDEESSHSEPLVPESNEKEVVDGEEECDVRPMLGHQDSEMKSPLPGSPEQIQKEIDDDANIPAENNVDLDPGENSGLQQPDEFRAESVPQSDECLERRPSEPAVTENALAVKDEDKNSHWLESDDETENLVEASSHNEVAVQNVEPVEPPQPLAMALMLDESVVSLSVETLIKECVKTSCDTCLYCNNAILITVNGGQLAAHLRSEHRYMPTKPEDSPEQVVQKIEEAMNDLKAVFMNASLASAYTQFDGTFTCLQCSYSTTLFKELVHHKRKLHHKVIFLCIMCKCNFFYYSQLLCHLCPGLYSPEVQNTLNYHCCFCNQDGIPSAFRLMVHLRKIHQACDICLTRYNDQSELFSHMIKQHKMNHLCYKCNLAYRSRDGINEHLFWKHGTESVLCRRCLQKKWPHAYHFCIPASTYTCEECSRIFTRAVALTVHRRAHNGDFPFACTDCDQKFISKKLLVVHRRDVHNVRPKPDEIDAQKEESQQEPVGGEEGENSVNDSDSKKRRKKKRKKGEIDAEKPLLDDLPPLNLSSDSEEDSDEEETTKSSAEKPLPPPEVPATSIDDETGTKIDSTEPAESATETPSDGPSASEVLPSIATEEPKVDVTETSTDATEVDERLPKTDVTDEAESTKENGDSAPADAPTAESSAEATANSLPEVESESPSTVAPAVDAETVEPTAPDAEIADSTAPVEESPAPSEPAPEVTIEQIRSCLMVEHSYCIPDSIFYSEDADADNSLDTTAERMSPKGRAKTHDRTSGCKSVTPRKRKRQSKRESSSSDSSSESDSSSSSCGSNCSCNQKSNSNCSSSSSASDCSTTPEKKQSKKSGRSRRDASAADDANESKNEQELLLNVRESDLDTDIETSDEDFYDKHPTCVPPVEEKAELSTLPVPQPTLPSRPILPTKKKSPRKASQRRRAPKIKISLGPQNNGTCVATSVSINLQPFDSPVVSTPTYRPAALNDSRPGIHLCKTNPMSPYTFSPNNISSEVHVSSNSFGSGADDSDRRSKRERVKNKFYGYSSSDEGSHNDSVKPVSIKKRLTAKRPPKVTIKQPFVGIRAKKPLIASIKRSSQPASSASTMAVAQPSLPPHLYRMPNYIKQQQQQELVQQLQRQLPQIQHQRKYQPSTSSSDDSDSDNLVINEPTLNDRFVNNRPKFRFPIYPPAEPANWHRGSISESTFAAAGPSAPSNEKLYCYCQCPYDEVSEMIGCDGQNCKYEWFHFECVGIMVPPKGAWYCPQCKNREAVPQFV